MTAATIYEYRDGRQGALPVGAYTGDLADAALIIDGVRRRRMLAGDRVTARRLEAVGRLVRDEAEMLDEHSRFGHAIPEPTYPPGATIGFLARHDGASRALRRANGLSVPEVDDATRS